MTFTINLPKDVEAKIRAHAEETYPEECCGTLIGEDNAEGMREITDIISIKNTKGENRERRFLIDPRALLSAERQADAQDLSVVGIYHSHPDHPSQASDFDRDHAMPHWSYVIISCKKGKSDTLQSWRLREDRSQFDEETVTT